MMVDATTIPCSCFKALSFLSLRNISLYGLWISRFIWSVDLCWCWLPVNVRCPFLGHLHYKSSSSPMHDEFDDAHQQYFFFETRRSSTQKRQGVTPLPCREFPACHLLHSSFDLRFASSTCPEKTRVVRFFATFHNFISSHLHSPWFLSCHESHLLVRVFFWIYLLSIQSFLTLAHLFYPIYLYYTYILYMLFICISYIHDACII
jgi:hypothetical protein